MLSGGRTVDGEVTQSSACRSLDFDVGTLEKIKDRFKSISVHFADI